MVDERPVQGRRSRALALSVVAVLTAACSSDAGSATTSTTAAPVVESTTGTTVVPTSTVTTSTTTSTTTTSTTVPPTTTIPLVTEGGIVRVANAAGVPGAGAELTGTLAGLGFDVRDPVNGAGAEESLEVSRVYYRTEAHHVAVSVSELMGDVHVLPMPTPPPIENALEGLGDATVLVMLGADLAGKPLPARSG